MVNTEQTANFSITRKSPSLYLVMMGLWLVIMVGAVPGLWRTYLVLDSIPAKVLFIPFIVFLVLFWFYGVYHLVLLVFSYLPKIDWGNRARSLARVQSFSPRVAVIYTTLNDFNREAAATLLNQDYTNYHVFLLDVSTNPDFRAQVDAFHQEHSSTTTLHRLQPRQGFKARSLNDTLKDAVGPEYEFFAVCDADNYWPVDFLSRTVPYFLLDEQLGFVQTPPTLTGRSEGNFSKDFESAVDASWALHQIPREKYGLLMCMGHSVVVRREAWEKSGGYPEIVQEDTAFTMALRRHGYCGLFEPEVTVGEEFPENFTSWRRRQYRLVQADTEIWITQMPAYLKSKAVSLTEKIDLIARTTRLPAQAITLIYLLLGFPFIPLLNGGGLSAASMDMVFAPLLSPGLVGITLLLAVAPLFPFFVYLRRRPLKIIPFLFHSITLHFTPLGVALASFIIYVLKGRAMFLVTGAKDGAAVQEQPAGKMRRFIQRLGAESRPVIALDIIAAIILGWVAITSGSLVILGIALVLLMSPLIRRYGWNNSVMSVAAYLPLALIIAGLVTSLSGGMGAY
ncbi:glycosyltransferase, partial [Chloroflexota bacterium]